jgi:hypothetical protein
MANSHELTAESSLIAHETIRYRVSDGQIGMGMGIRSLMLGVSTTKKPPKPRSKPRDIKKKGNLSPNRLPYYVSSAPPPRHTSVLRRYFATVTSGSVVETSRGQSASPRMRIDLVSSGPGRF